MGGRSSHPHISTTFDGARWSNSPSAQLCVTRTLPPTSSYPILPRHLNSCSRAHPPWHSHSRVIRVRSHSRLLSTSNNRYPHTRSLRTPHVAYIYSRITRTSRLLFSLDYIVDPSRLDSTLQFITRLYWSSTVPPFRQSFVRSFAFFRSSHRS